MGSIGFAPMFTAVMAWFTEAEGQDRVSAASVLAGLEWSEASRALVRRCRALVQDESSAVQWYGVEAMANLGHIPGFYTP